MDGDCTHFYPPRGWMNDPCGLVFRGGTYHLFYQFNPAGDSWGNIHWGHSTSADLLHWHDYGPALFPDPRWGHPFTGSVVEDGGVLVAVFTAASEVGDGQWHQEQANAYSTDDGKSWTWHEENPVLANPGLADFRDPRVVWHRETAAWFMAVSAGDRVLFYRSTNLLNWEATGEYGVQYPEHRGVWECPDMLDLGPDQPENARWVLLFSIGEGLPESLPGVHYLFGRCDGRRFMPDTMPDVRVLDEGPDFYAFQSWTGGGGVGVAWANNYSYAHCVRPRDGEPNGIMTIPRRLWSYRSTDGTRLAALPVLPRGGTDAGCDVQPLSNCSPGGHRLQWSILTIYAWREVEGIGRRSISFLEGSTELLVLTVNYRHGVLAVRRNGTCHTASLEGFAFERTIVAPQPHAAAADEATGYLLFQRGLVELFAFGGRLSFTVRIYPAEANVSLTIRS